jgi:hypothetical protein
MKEVWKDIVGFEGFYQVSNLGRVKSLEKKVPYGYGLRTIPERILKNNINQCGYCYVVLYKDTCKRKHKVHRLVAEAFIENPNNKKCVNHKDGNKQNNCVDNLEWVTHSENMQHASDSGLWESWNKGKHYKHRDWMSDEAKARLRERMKGNKLHSKPHSEETKKKISQTKRKDKAS